MRKSIIWLLVCCLLLTAVSFSLAEEADSKTTTSTKTTADTKDEKPTVATVHTGNGGSLNMRKKASTKADRVLRIPDGETVTLLDDEDDGWYHVSYNNRKGYVQAKFLVIGDATATVPTDDAATTAATGKTTADAADTTATAATAGTADAEADATPAAPTGELAVLTSNQRLRKEADASSKSLGSLEEGAEVTVVSKDTEWANVYTEDEKTGYLPMSALHFSTLRTSADYPGMNQITEAEARGVAKRAIYEKYGNVFAGLTVTATLQSTSATYETPYYQFDYYDGSTIAYSCYVHSYTREVLYVK